MEYVQLKEICSINMGQSPDSKSYNNDGNGMPFYQGNADFGETHPVTRVWCTEPTKIAEKDDILLSVRAPIGALNIADETCCIGRGLAAITPNAKLATTTFIYWCLKCKNAELNSKGTGSTFKAINKKTLEETLIPKVSFAEQQYISETLQRVFSIITHRRQQLQVLDELVKARFVEMFGDPVSNEKGWRTKPLLELGSCKNGMNFHYDDSGIEINCLGVGDFKDHSVIKNTADLPTVSLNEMPSEEYLLKDDDIVFVRSNGNKALVGRSIAVYPAETPTTFSGFCIRFRKTDDAVLVPYLLRVLKTDSIRTKMVGRGANIQNLNQQTLGSLVIPMPPIELQKQFVSFAKQLDKSKVVVQKALDEAQLLFGSLMQKYFG